MAEEKKCYCGSEINMFSKFLTEFGHEMDKMTEKEKIREKTDKSIRLNIDEVYRLQAILSPLQANLLSMKDDCKYEVKPLITKLNGIKLNVKEIESIVKGKIKVKTGFEIKDALFWIGDTWFNLRNEFDAIIRKNTKKL